MTLLSEADLEAALAVSDWKRNGQCITREWEFADFVQAVAFVNLVADAAEEANHHPDIHLHGWNKVRLDLSTHSEGGLTQADFDMAARIDGLV